MGRHHEKPLRRVYRSGQVVWIARWTDRNGRRRLGWPPEIRGTFELRREAQDAIDACYRLHYDEQQAASRETVGGYAKVWLRRHPRSERTERGYVSRLGTALEVRLNDRPLAEWPLRSIRRGEMQEFVAALYERGLAFSSARATVNVISSLFEDAIGDELMHANPARSVRMRASDPRVQTRARPVRVFPWEAMRAFAAEMPGPQGPAMGRVLSDCGLRLGELLALHRADVEDGWLVVRNRAWRRETDDGTKRGAAGAETGRRVPLPGDLRVMLQGLPPRLDTRLLFPAADGRGPWGERTWRGTFWMPARDKLPAMRDARPHEFRHSYVSLMRAAGVDPADLAEWTGHTVTTATSRYTHSTGAARVRALEVLREVAFESHRGVER